MYFWKELNSTDVHSWAGLWDWTLLQGSCRTLGLISKCKVWLTPGKWDCFLVISPKLTMGHPNSW